MRTRPGKKALLLAALGLGAFAAGPNRVNLFYQVSAQPYSYNNYLQGTIERQGETLPVHLQFVRNWQMQKSGKDRYLLQEWGKKYQGGDFNFSEVGLPGPDERVERIMDALGRVDKVTRYPAGHRYYLNLLVFPDHPVAAGDTWKYEDRLNLNLFGKTVPCACAVAYQLENILLYRKNFRSAKILLNGSCRSAPGPNPELDYRFSGKIFFDLDRGRELDYQLNYSWVKSQPDQDLKDTANLELYSIFEK